MPTTNVKKCWAGGPKRHPRSCRQRSRQSRGELLKEEGNRARSLDLELQGQRCDLKHNFSELIENKIGDFCSEFSCQKLIISLVLEKKRKFFAEN
jgi:hypothetical protein